ncbi:hypothetical protein ACFORO_01715 [Amycolatopsis halotolerans]|uniref:Uncharacterized protein n=1 Tax=Amycolatopsis halotolerans TaxID=330083 RepID=A0ABV7QBC1_9PSEU
MDATSVREALSVCGAIAWSRISVGVDPVDGLVRIPFVVWRYDDPPSGLSDRFNVIVEEFPGAFDWRFESLSRNWTLTSSLGRRSVLPAAHHNAEEMNRIKRTSQQSCIDATRELEIIMDKFADR